MESYGHFGRPSWIVAGLAVAALLLHFAVPYGVVEFRSAAAPDDVVVWRGDVMEQRDFLPAELVANNPSPTVTLAGSLLAVFGAALLLILGYQPLQVTAARLVGYGGGAMTALGAGLMWMSSMYSVGTGFSTFLGTIFGTKFLSNFWAISPVFVAAASMALLVFSLKVMTTVVSSKDHLRERAQHHGRSAVLALAMMGTILLVPWSIGLMPDGTSDFADFDLGDDDAPYFFSAEDAQSITPAEGVDGGRMRFTRDGDFGALSLALHILLGLTWTAYVWHLVWPAAAIHVSTGADPKILRTADLGIWAVGLFWALSCIFYIITWVLFTPNGTTEHTFLPGFFPLLVLVPAWMLLRQHLPTLKSFMGAASPATKAADFDA